MPNIQYWTAGDADTEALATQIKARRGGRLLNIDRILLHCPPAAKGWGAFMGAIRTELSLPAFHRELAICAVAVLNSADYELHHHRPLFAAAGASVAQIEALSNIEGALNNIALFDASARAVLRFTLESTRNVKISAATLQAVGATFPGDRALTEMTLLVAAYNMVSRLIVAAGVEIESA